MAAMDDHDPSSNFLQDHHHHHHDHYFYSSDTNCNLPTPGDDLFTILESLDDGLFTADFNMPPSNPTPPPSAAALAEQPFVFTTSSSADQSCELIETSSSPKPKRLKLSPSVSPRTASFSDQDGRMSHITVERNRRKQMNDHLSVLRSLMPCFYVKRGDQASIIGGVVDYINELQQVLQSLEAKKQRKSYSIDVLSPRQQLSSPRPPPASAGPSPPVLSPRKPPLSPRLAAAISPRTPQPTSPYKPSASRTLILPQGPPQLLPNHHNTNNNYLIPSPTIATTSSLEPSPTCSTASSSVTNNNSIDNVNDLFANSKSTVADVEVKFSGANVLLKTVSPPIPGQALRIISALEDLSLEILHVSITTVDDTMHNSFTIKIGIECQLSAEELALQIQQTFC